ncbi:MAG: FkbM family methyltransferase [Nanoarchaeota archaeon]|nr:FkbM family methyltransferase [Nanoarchaeota archaeon]
MINISKISGETFLGKLLRLPLGCIPKNAVMRILQGPNKGLKWIKGSGNNSYWLGAYEIEKQQIMKGALREGMVFYDIGAHVGFFTILAARQVGRKGLVVAFEPFEKNLHCLEKNVALNGFQNVIIKKGVVTEKIGHSYFQKGESSAGGHISDKGEMVPAYSIDELVAKGLQRPDVVKIDVQGAALLALRGMAKTLKNNNVKIFIAIDNGPRQGIPRFSKKDIHDFLKSIGYSAVGMRGEKIPGGCLEEANEIFACK